MDADIPDVTAHLVDDSEDQLEELDLDEDLDVLAG